ncbi:hypothetical protein ACFSKY_22760 [Azotobacter chroococcum]|uniref:Uncharacterized protein n=1 Tax=Azotobacter chroococcum TaxID=353 RepID=A0A4R1PVA2_9GAMM|nr:hypothetical protein [Azotobacter chroococcum]MEE4460759.1 hypothetical protein [Azotobacter chroococcum]TBV90493.1 hypothetical protein E0E53_23450 [Azotobacter chroococcum]TCL32014.1 hypothetical protein EV691_1098 [Azotobacter chroococcum]
MSGVKRYDYGYKDDEWGGQRYLGLIEKPDGKLVRYEDHDRIVGERDAVIEQCSWECTWRQVEIEGLRDERDALLAKVADLRAEVEDFRKAIQELRDERAALADENQRLRKDADRYRFIRDIPHTFQVQECLRFQRNSVMDDIIDAAMEASRCS